MTQIIDDDPKSFLASRTNQAIIAAGIALLVPQRFKELVGPTIETVIEVGILLYGLHGRWRAGGVSVPFVGAKKK